MEKKLKNVAQLNRKYIYLLKSDEIDIYATDHEYQYFKRECVTNRSFS